MVIKNITINSFGKLNNYSLDLSDGLNVVYGPNEYGKTTIMEFIKLMFYSRNEKTATDKLIREKYKPWNGSKMSGSIIFEHGGQTYKVQKEISDKYARNDKTVIQNMSVGEVIKLGKDEEVGEYFFGIDVKSFERSSYIKNLGGADFETPKSLKSSKDTLADKMFSNLLDGGEEEISQSGVIAKVKEAMRALKTPTGKGEIRKLEDKISELELKINDINNFEQGQEDVKKDLESLGALIKEQKALETKIKKFEEYRHIEETQKLIEMVSEKEKIRTEAMKFGVNLDGAEEIFDTLEKYEKDLNEINIKTENIKNLSESRGKNFKRISEEEKNRFETLLGKFESEKEKHEIAKYLTLNNLRDYKLNEFDFFEPLDNIGSKLKDAERLKASKTTELEKSQVKAKKINSGFIFADGILLMCSVICIFANLLNLFPFVFGGFLCASLAHLYCFYKHKKTAEALENEISEKDSEIEKLMSDFKMRTEKIKSEAENNLKSTEKEIKKLLDEKMCRSRMEFYQTYAKSQKFQDFEAALRSGEDKLRKIQEDLKKFLNLTGVKINVDNFLEDLEVLKNLNTKYTHMSDQIKYKASAVNLKNTDLQSLKSVLKEYSGSDTEFESADIDNIYSKFAELEKMNLHSAYIETQKKIINISEDPEKLKAYAKKLSLQKGNMEKYYECLKVSLEAFEEVSDELRKNFNPKLNSRASEIFKELTGGKYHNIYIQRNYDFIVGGEVMDRYSHYFSSGTVDQAYLAARIAISELVSGSKVPLIFDDTLMQYDDERLKNTIKFLQSYAKENAVQSVIFTCHDHIKSIV